MNAYEAMNPAICEALELGLEFSVVAYGDGEPSATFLRNNPSPEEKARQLAVQKVIDARIAVERRVVRNFIRTAKAAGFDVHSVHDGEERHKVRNETEAMEHVFGVDEAHVAFIKRDDPKRARETLFVVLGNGCECLADMSCGRADWDAVVEASSAYVDTQYE